MNIRKLHDAKAVKNLRQPAQTDPFVFDAEHVRLCECGTSNMRQTHRERSQRSVGLLGTAIRRDNTSTLVPSNRSRHILELIGANLPGKRLVSGAHYRDLTSRAQ